MVPDQKMIPEIKNSRQAFFKDVFSKAKNTGRKASQDNIPKNANENDEASSTPESKLRRILLKTED
jgi:hypothetical protein